MFSFRISTFDILKEYKEAPAPQPAQVAPVKGICLLIFTSELLYVLFLSCIHPFVVSFTVACLFLCETICLIISCVLYTCVFCIHLCFVVINCIVFSNLIYIFFNVMLYSGLSLVICFCTSLYIVDHC